MSFPLDMLARLQELALMPTDDPERMRFVAELVSADEETRACWAAVLEEDNALRIALQRTEPPVDLLEKLQKLPDANTAGKKRSASFSIPWPVAAAAVLGVLAIGGYLIWNVYQPPKGHFVQLPKAPAEIVGRITSLTIADYLAAPPLDVASSDPKTVTASLQARVGDKMPFPVILPAAPTDFHLQGGSILTLGSGLAVYTAWMHNGHRYALFQFPPANFSMPKEFMREEPQPSPAQSALATYRLALWPGKPGGICTWVAIGERSTDHDPFSLSTD
jgi:anti-sigma factor RsiW